VSQVTSYPVGGMHPLGVPIVVHKTKGPSIIVSFLVILEWRAAPSPGPAHSPAGAPGGVEGS